MSDRPTPQSLAEYAALTPAERDSMTPAETKAFADRIRGGGPSRNPYANITRSHERQPETTRRRR
jgi:hypothetical protein